MTTTPAVVLERAIAARRTLPVASMADLRTLVLAVP
eukprot:CAMPEP_0204360362 /NCGR_PEP_ID=MMETSP0469-20131031/37978_1 /ASSEMBLY_ACC=CAM_ASM_000384 /TAXON_ID=2969 /ORGANISM="Oxyrrhis marina" /LENGTH=35 /DNA_ID= /DNA_START= /DNA_END= /DNA_ORIENTATION=